MKTCKEKTWVELNLKSQFAQ